MHNRVEPPTGTTNYRPDVYAEPRTGGAGSLTQRVALDVTFSCPYAPANLCHTTTTAGASFHAFDSKKQAKYAPIVAISHNPIELFPCGTTTSGVIDP